MDGILDWKIRTRVGWDWVFKMERPHGFAWMEFDVEDLLQDLIQTEWIM